MISSRGQAFALALFALVLIFAGSQHQQAYAYYSSSPAAAAAANFLGALDYKVELDAGQLIDKQDRADFFAKNQPRDLSIDKIKREVMGFNVSATDVKIHMTPSRIDADRTRLDMEVKGKDVAVDSAYFHKKFSRLDVDTIYGVYDARTDRITVHIPFTTAFSLAFTM